MICIPVSTYSWISFERADSLKLTNTSFEHWNAIFSYWLCKPILLFRILFSKTLWQRTEQDSASFFHSDDHLHSTSSQLLNFIINVARMPVHNLLQYVIFAMFFQVLWTTLHCLILEMEHSCEILNATFLFVLVTAGFKRDWGNL